MNDTIKALRLALTALESCDCAHPSDGGRQWYDDKAVAAAEEAVRASLAAQEQAEPIGYMSPGQIEHIKDPGGVHGSYIPMRKTPAGNFTLALYTHPPAAPKRDQCNRSAGWLDGYNDGRTFQHDITTAAPKRQRLPQHQVDALVFASREVDEGPSALVRRVEAALGIT